MDEVVREAQSHMTNVHRVIRNLGTAQSFASSSSPSSSSSSSLEGSNRKSSAPSSSSSSSVAKEQQQSAPFDPLIQIRRLIHQTASDLLTLQSSGIPVTSPLRHAPIIVIGPVGSGKTSLLSQVFTSCPEWINDADPEAEVIRIVRLIGKSPGCSYASELLRSLCQQICLEFVSLEMQDLVSCEQEPSTSTRFQEMIKLIENSSCGQTSNVHVVILLDDLQNLKSIQTSAILSWLPFTLPPNVHLICSVDHSASSVVQILKSRISNDNIIRLMNIKSPDSVIQFLRAKCLDHAIKLSDHDWDRVTREVNQIFEEKNRIPGEALRKESSIESPGIQDTVTGSSDSMLMQSTHSDCESQLQVQPNQSEGEMSTCVQQQLSPLVIELLACNILSHWDANSSSVSRQKIGSEGVTSLPSSVSQVVDAVMDDLESNFGKVLISKLSLYIGMSRYGFRESEILELISTERESNHENIWREMRSKLLLPDGMGGSLLQEFNVLGRIYINWSHDVINCSVRQRYGSGEGIVNHVHSELSQAFFLGFQEVSNTSTPMKETAIATASAPTTDPVLIFLEASMQSFSHLILPYFLFRAKCAFSPFLISSIPSIYTQDISVHTRVREERMSDKNCLLPSVTTSSTPKSIFLFPGKKNETPD